MRALLAVGAMLALGACSGGASPAAAPPSVSPPAARTPSPTMSPPSGHPTSTGSVASPAAASRPTAASPTRVPSTWTASVRRVTAEDLPHSWHPGCPVAPAQLRLLTLPYRDFGGVRRTGRLVVSAQVADQVVAVFRSLYAERFPIRSLRLVDDFGGSDDSSMAADNTSGFNCRDAVGGSGWSQHAYGLAVDVNPRENPYLYGGKVLPPEGAPYADRSVHRPGMAYRASAVNRAFAAAGWGWGGQWNSPDYQHFSSNGA